MKRWMKNEELFALKCTAIQAFICSLPYLLPPVTEEALRVCVCVTGNLGPKKKQTGDVPLIFVISPKQLASCQCTRSSSISLNQRHTC